ncbi:MAG: hypothetical protein KGZ74_10765, partial [Chitinophagaceae bacterium]|nr:hypothetical protein [Chitinophagaceae bacterium]
NRNKQLRLAAMNLAARLADDHPDNCKVIDGLSPGGRSRTDLQLNKFVQTTNFWKKTLAFQPC